MSIILFQKFRRSYQKNKALENNQLIENSSRFKTAVTYRKLPTINHEIHQTPFKTLRVKESTKRTNVHGHTHDHNLTNSNFIPNVVSRITLNVVSTSIVTVSAPL